MKKVSDFVPIEKQSKKMQKEFYSRKRGSWNGVCPATRTVKSKKSYDRKRQKRETRAAADEQTL